MNKLMARLEAKMIIWAGLYFEKLPKNCLTCVFMDFADDELDELRCYHVENKNGAKGTEVEEDYICHLYKQNKAVLEDAKQGCW